MRPDDERLIARYLDQVWMEKGLSQNSLESYRRDLSQFATWLVQNGPGLLAVTGVQVQSYLAWRHQNKLSSRSSARFLSCLRGFYRLQIRDGYVQENPLGLIENPKLARSLPKSLTESDVEALLAAPELDDPVGLRDKAMLELLYASGLRVTELVELTMAQVNLRQGIVRVMGKGSKERLVPMGEEAASWMQRFLREARPVLLNNVPDEVVFPSLRAQAMTRQTFWHRIKHWAQVAGINKPLSPHT